MRAKIDRTYIVSSAARLLDMGVSPKDLDAIKRITGRGRKTAKEISESMQSQMGFLEALNRMDMQLRA